MVFTTLVGVAVAAFAYLWYDYRFPTWKEEVVLPDGRKIIVKQRRDFIEGVPENSFSNMCIGIRTQLNSSKTADDAPSVATNRSTSTASRAPSPPSAAG